jgi:hypothetical protein
MGVRDPAARDPLIVAIQPVGDGDPAVSAGEFDDSGLQARE